MSKEIDDDVPIYFSPGDDEAAEEIVEVDRKALLADEPKRDWQRYQPAVTLEQAADEATKRGEEKFKRKKNFRTNGSNEKSAPQEPVEDPEQDPEVAREKQSKTLDHFLRKSGRFLKPNLIKPADPEPAPAPESPQTQTAAAASVPYSPGKARKQVRVLLLLACVNVFLAGFWCGSFLFPNNKVVTTLREMENNDAAPAGADAHRWKGDTSVADVVSKLNPVVVNVDTRPRRIGTTSTATPFQGVQKFFEPSPYANARDMPKGQAQQAQATGVIISPDGYILTSNHVVPPGTEIRVTLFDQREFRAMVMGRDAYSDLAVLKVNANGLPIAHFADSKKVKVGDWAVVMGSPYGYDHSVTLGLVSGVNRVVGDFNHHIPLIQTDAQISPGNSGGPMTNIDGEIIGIVCAASNRGALGINFAIPSNTASEVTKKLIEKGSLARPFLGIYMDDIDPNKKKAQTLSGTPLMVVISNVVKDAPADKVGLQRGDIILVVNGQQVKSADQVRSILHALKPGDNMDFKVRRLSLGQDISKRVKLENYPESY